MERGWDMGETGNIVLIGLSGTGKTTTGKLLAERLGKVFVDLDQEIEYVCGMSVEEIFRSRGEEYFRSQERLAVRSVVLRRGLIVATGGGVVLASENVADLKTCGVVVLLKAPAEVILGRLERDSVARPLLNNADRLQGIEKMMKAREEKYRFADFVVDTTSRSPEEVVEAIVAFLPAEVLPA